MITVKSLHKYFNRGKQNEIHVINDVSLQLPERGMVALFGKSGCGKTTLLNVLGGLDTFGSGEVAIDGNDIRRNPDDIRNKYIGYIFQNYNLNKEETCFENVADALRLCGMKDKAEIEKRVTAALKNVDMEKFRLRTPDTLSGGQQQRIAIARAIVKNPRIILADEPTGNLDEANTVIIMELLRQIAKEHLVLLVTHEANLVDYYCDTVIELSDGKIVGEHTNDTANGYSTRDKNDVFLGELEKSELKSADAQIEYYGETPQTPVKLKIVHSGGKIYLRVDTPKVQIIDATSEVRLREGVFKQEEHGQAASKNIDMSALPPVKSEKCGELFTFGSAVKSGWRANFKKGKKGKRFLRVCMGLFAAVFVLVSAVFGTSFNELLKVKRAYSHNTFYVYTPVDGDVSDTLLQAVGAADSGIDYVRLYGMGIPYSDETVKFNTGFFETFSSAENYDSFATNAVFLDESLCKNLPEVLGKTSGLENGEMVITTAVADELLKLSSVGFITEYKDLIGLTTSSFRVDDKNMYIAGIVKSSEPAVYVSEIAMAKYIINDAPLYIYRAADYGIVVEDGEIFYRRSDGTDGASVMLEKGDTVTVAGEDFTVAKVARGADMYETWCAANGKKLGADNLDAYMQEYIHKKIVEEHPDKIDTAEYYTLFSEYWGTYFFAANDEYFAYFDEYLAERYVLECDDIVWWAVVKHLPAAKAIAMCYYVTSGTGWDDIRTYGMLIKEQTGAYPSWEDAYAAVYGESGHGPYWDITDNLCYEYKDTYYEEYVQNYKAMPTGGYLSDADYIAVSKQWSKTQLLLTRLSVVNVYNPVTGDYTERLLAYSPYYTLVHSSDPAKTKAYLTRTFAQLSTEDGMPVLITPDDIRENLMQSKRASIWQNLIALVVVLALLCLCMYFMFRSSFMARIKEVGIYRAIGTSKRNILFKFFVEALLLALLTVFIGYALMSLFMAALGTSALMAIILYYPAWMALCVFVLLMGVSILCGLLPVFTLLRKSPSAILAKYDV